MAEQQPVASTSFAGDQRQQDTDNAEKIPPVMNNNVVVEDVEQEEEQEEEEVAEYDVEAIRAKRKNPKTGTFEYLVKWENYPETQNSWEPIENLRCPDIIARFEEENDRVGRKRRSTTSQEPQQPQLQQQSARKRLRKSIAATTTANNSITNKQFEVVENLLVEDEADNGSTETLSSENGVSNQADRINKDLVESRHQQVRGFDRGLPIEKILSACLEDQDKVSFFIKWKNESTVDLIDASEVEEKAPKDMLHWYRERMYYAIKNPQDLHPVVK